jgi:hypothetical protein
MKFCIVLAFSSFLFGASLPRITYSKSFPGSVPPYVAVEIASDGTTVYRETPDDANPITFQMSPEDTKEIFDLAEKLDHFKRPLDANLKIAFMGTKTFRFEDGTGKYETKFNYSQDEDAKTLLDKFERVTETQMLYFDLERTIRFDKLGVNRALLQLEMALDRKRLVGRERFLPLLDRIAKNETYMHMARERAASMADFFRKEKAKPE